MRATMQHMEAPAVHSCHHSLPRPHLLQHPRLGQTGAQRSLLRACARWQQMFSGHHLDPHCSLLRACARWQQMFSGHHLDRCCSQARLRRQAGQLAPAAEHTPALRSRARERPPDELC